MSAVPAPDMDADSAELFSRVFDAHLVVLTVNTGLDPKHGRRLPSLLEETNLVHVDADGTATMWRGREAGGELWRLTFAPLREPMLATGRVSATDIDQACELCRHGLSFVSPLAMAAWGQRPVPAYEPDGAQAPPAVLQLDDSGRIIGSRCSYSNARQVLTSRSKMASR